MAVYILEGYFFPHWKQQSEQSISASGTTNVILKKESPQPFRILSGESTYLDPLCISQAGHYWYNFEKISVGCLVDYLPQSNVCIEHASQTDVY